MLCDLFSFVQTAPDPAHFEEPKFIRMPNFFFFFFFFFKHVNIDLFFLFDVKGYTLTSCGAKGRVGPYQNQCTNAYQDGVTKVQVMNQGRLSGVQVWTVPTNGLYT